MKAMVGESGVLIPRRLLRGIKEVEIRKEGAIIVVEPAAALPDPVFGLGDNPVRTGVGDGAEQHDAHLYSAHGTP